MNSKSSELEDLFLIISGSNYRAVDIKKYLNHGLDIFFDVLMLYLNKV